MNEFETWVPVEIGRPREVVWDSLTSADEFAKWWLGTDELVAAEPGFEPGATLQFSSGWSATIEECVPTEVLAFAGHRFALSDVGDAATRLEWSQWIQGGPAFDHLTGIDAARPFRQRMVVALDRFKELVETEHVLVRVAPDHTAAPVEPPPGPDAEPEARHIRVFVSSTFLDMVADRDQLAKEAFPVLRRLCRERGVVLSDIDLRWGITDEQQAEGKVLPICLTEIDKCRPYFIGLLGERYGSVLGEIPHELVDRLPWLAEHRHRSVTELEILHGVLNDPEMADQAVFYFRDPAYVDALPDGERTWFREGPTPDEIAAWGREEAGRRAEDRQRWLGELKDTIRDRFPVRTYRDLQQLGDFVVEDFTAMIDEKFPAGSAPTSNEREAMGQAGFAAELRAVFVDRPGLFAALDDHVDGSGPPLIVSGDPGSGKSALLANWVATRQAREPEIPVVPYSSGATGWSPDPGTMFSFLLHRIARTRTLAIDVPGDLGALQKTFAETLQVASASGKLVVVVDGADGITGQEADGPLNWVPLHLPPEVRLIVSTSPGPVLDEALRRSWSTLEVPGLDPGAKERLITAYLARFAKSLSDEHTLSIVAHRHSSSPRFLGVLLEELRRGGDHAGLGPMVDGYLAVGDIVDLYGKVLERCEDEHGHDPPGLVEDALCALWAAREGLSENELAEILGSDGEWLPRALWSPLALAAEALIVDRSGLIGLRNHQVRHAVERLYLARPHHRRNAHLCLAAHFGGSEAGRRRAAELPWQLAQAEEWDELYGVVSDETMLTELWEQAPWDLRRYWAEVTRHTGRSMIDGYRDIIEHPERHRTSAGCVAQLLVGAGYLDEALPLAQHAVDSARQDHNAAALVVALNNLSPILAARGDLDARLGCARELEEVATRIGHRKGVAGGLASRAGVHVVRGEFDEAMHLYRREEEIRRKLGDSDGLQYCLGNQAQIRVDRAELEQALKLRREQERLCREIGNPHGLRIALGTQAVMHRMRGDLDRATDLHREEERICRETGDQLGLQASLGNQALIIQAKGDLDTALARFQEQEEICRELGVLQDLATSFNNQAGILMLQGDFEGAERLFAEQEQVCRQLGYDLGLQAALGNRGLLRLDRGEAEEAVDLLREQEEICRSRGFPEFLVQCLNNLVMPLRMLGREDEADACGSEALELVERHGLRAHP